MKLLALDTSMPQLSVALTDGETLLGNIALEGRSSRNEKLLPAVDWLLEETGVERTAIELIAVTRGPGSFTGVRIALATVQGLAFSLGCRVCAMSTHAAVGFLETTPVVVYSDAGRGEYYVSKFDAGRELLAPTLASREEFERIAEGSRRIDVATVAADGVLSLQLARAALRIAERGDLDLFGDTTPIYVRLAEAEARLIGS